MKLILFYILILFSINCLGQHTNDFLYPLGNIENHSYEADSLRNGLVIDTFPNGKTKQFAFYVNGEAFGMVYNYFDHGKKDSYGKMYHGKRVGLWKEYYYMNGNLKKEVSYSGSSGLFHYEMNYFESGKVWHATFNSRNLYTHYEYYLSEDGDTQFTHRVVDSLKKIYTYSEFHSLGFPNVIGYKKYTLGYGWESIGTWNWYTETGKLIRRKVYSSDPYGID